MAVNRTSKAKGKILDVPNAPTIGTATDSTSGGAYVSFTAASVGGPSFSYTATSNPGGYTGTGTTSPILVNGLTIGTPYTFTVSATNPSGTSASSAASNSMTPVFTPTGSYESIATTTLSGVATTITFNSIPQTYTHLQLRYINLSSAQDTNILCRFNNDGGTGSLYNAHGLQGDGTTVTGFGYASGTAIGYLVPGIMGGSTYPGVAVVDFLDYTNTNKNKTVRTLYGRDSNGTGLVQLTSGLWRNTNAITRIDLTTGTGTFNQYSHFALYGIK